MARRKPKQSLLSAGLSLLTVGALMLWGPSLLGNSAFIDAFKAGLRYPGWLALGLGAVLTALHILVDQRRAVPPSFPARQPHCTRTERKHPVEYDQAAVRRILQTGGERIEPSFAAPASAPRSAAEPATAAAAHERLTHWSPEVFTAIEWRRFEAVCEALFAQAGFETRTQSHGADGGVDIWLHSRNANGPVAVVQCKHWQGKPVPVSAVREFFGVMVSHKLARGTYATSSTFTADALAFAQANGINALDGTRLLAQIAHRTPAQQAELLKIAFEGEYGRPTCASCGVKMVERKPRNGGQRFWGCANYPRCRTTLSMARSAANAI